MKVETRAEAARLNRTGQTDPYLAANGHRMIASLRFPRAGDGFGDRRPYQVGDEIRSESWSAWCAPGCNHSELDDPEDY